MDEKTPVETSYLTEDLDVWGNEGRNNDDMTLDSPDDS